MKKGVRWHLLERAKTMAGTVREAYWVVPGRARDALFSRLGATVSPEGLREVSRRTFCDFGSPLRGPRGIILGEKRRFF